MVLPAPNLDDRHFQDLVDDAKRLVQQRCPEWTDHNVSDPGVTLIEAFAQMVDQLIYRLNRVPDRNYVKFLELIGVELRPPAAARGDGDVLAVGAAAADRAGPRRDRGGHAAHRRRRPGRLHHRRGPARSCRARSPRGRRASAGGERRRPHHGAAGRRASSPCFSAVAAARRRAADRAVRAPCRPARWCSGWTARSAASASTRATRRWSGRPGPAPAGAPARSTATTPAASTSPATSSCTCPANHETVDHRPAAGRLAALPAAAAGRRTSRRTRASPQIVGVRRSPSAAPPGSCTPRSSATRTSGVSDGTPGQRFALQRRPGGAVAERARCAAGHRPGRRRADRRGPPVRALRRLRAGRPALPPRPGRRRGPVRPGGAAGRRRRCGSYGAVPPLGARLRLSAYRTGGGRRGNVARGLVRVLKTSVPYVARVENRHPAAGGADGETLDDAKLRGPLLLRSRGRAVTAEDFEELARDVAPDAARVTCLPATSNGAAATGTAAAGGSGCWSCPRWPPTTSAGSRADLGPRRASCCAGSATTSTRAGWSAPGWSSSRRDYQG